MSNDETSCEYRLTKDEVTEQMLRLMPSGARLVRSALIVAAAGVVLAFVPGWRFWAFGLVTFALFWVFFFRRHLRRYVVSAVAQHPELLQPQTLRFGESGLRVSNTISSLELPWERIQQIDDSDEFLLVRMDSLGSGAIIPKRAFTSVQLQEFMRHAQGMTGRP